MTTSLWSLSFSRTSKPNFFKISSCHILQFSHHLHDPSLGGSSPVFQCSSQTGAQCSMCGLKSAKNYEIITFLDLLAVVLLVQAQVWLVARTDSWLIFGLLLIRTPSSFPAEMNLPSLYPQMMTQVLFIEAWTPSPRQRALFIFAFFCTRSVQ